MLKYQYNLEVDTEWQLFPQKSQRNQSTSIRRRFWQIRPFLLLRLGTGKSSCYSRERNKFKKEMFDVYSRLEA